VTGRVVGKAGALTTNLSVGARTFLESDAPQPFRFTKLLSVEETVVLVEGSATASSMDLNGTPPVFSSLNSTHQALLHDSSPE
jgi:hypothetical protein